MEKLKLKAPLLYSLGLSVINNNEHCVAFMIMVIIEKLKGIINADILHSRELHAANKAVTNKTFLIDELTERNTGRMD